MNSIFLKVFRELVIPWVRENVLSTRPTQNEFDADQEFQTEVNEDCTGVGMNPLREFLSSCDLKTSNEDNADVDDEAKNKVVISTIHKAKGREWNTVFVPRFEEGFLPGELREKFIDRKGELQTVPPGQMGQEKVRLHREEEMRLAHVAVTRAKRNLFVSKAGDRSSINIGREGDAHIVYHK